MFRTPLIKARSIDDVPILALTFHSARYDHLTLRRLVAQVDDAVKQVPQVAETTLIGGAHRQLRVLLDPARLASRNLSPAGLIPMLQQANRQYVAGELTSDNQEVVVETGAFLHTCRGRGQRGRGRVWRQAGLSARRGDHRGRRGRTPPIRVFWDRRRERCKSQRPTRRHPEHRQTAGRERHHRGRRGAPEN